MKRSLAELDDLQSPCFNSSYSRSKVSMFSKMSLGSKVLLKNLLEELDSLSCTTEPTAHSWEVGLDVH
jgi:hypothetical protein